MELKKENLKDCDIVTHRNGEQSLYLAGWFYDNTGNKFIGIDDYNEELKDESDKDNDVMEILRPSYKNVAKRAVTKMTVEEIKAIIGYDIEIVEK